jgi:uncharacterized protein (DUF2236 family)
MTAPDRTTPSGSASSGSAPAASTLPLPRDTVSWRVNGDPAPFLGASTALLLQVAHPLVAAGVAQHSDFQSDPWSRLYRTLDTVLKVVFGSPDQVRRMQRRLASVHRPVQGFAADGRAYDARDPSLGMWVWATLVHTGLLAYERVYGELCATERERFYQETKLFAQASGVPPELCPTSWAAFITYYDHVVEEELERTPECLEVARATFVVPSPPVLRHLGSWANRWTAAALMPPRAREIYGLRWNDRREHAFRRFLRVYGALMRLLPRRARELPAVLVIDHDLLETLERKRKERRQARARRERQAA